MKKLITILLILIPIICFAQGEQWLWLDTTNGQNILRKVGSEYPLPIQILIIDKDTSKVPFFFNPDKIERSIPIQIINENIIDEQKYIRREQYENEKV